MYVTEIYYYHKLMYYKDDRNVEIIVYIDSGDYAILLSTGLSWYAAMLLNFFSSLTAIVGFFIGVAIGTNSETSNQWILTLAVGLFLYVALVDLVSNRYFAGVCC